jgi:ferric-dicitrate binding protein FerR (iron transport regulator)
MDQSLINKYFNDRCSENEVEQVLSWFQTSEGKAFIEDDIERQNRRLLKNADMFLYPEIDSKKIFSRIQQHKKRGLRRSRWFMIRVASILLIAAVVSSLLFFGGIITLEKPPPTPAPISYVTAPGQQKIFSLSDGTMIRLNEGSKLTVPGKTTRGKRTVALKGEAYFEVAHDQNHPFLVNVNGAMIRVLGTKFNVKIDSVAGNMQVAVIQGKVSLKKKGTDDAAGAFLTRNHFGILRLSDSQITIERGNVRNYLSWINKRLIFKGESLGQISRQLERLYDIRIQFETEQIKELNLTADFEKTDIRKVLNVISNTLDIHYKMNKNHVVWMR